MKTEYRTRNAGFTLVELLVAMAVSLVVGAAIYTVYLSQTRTQVTQEVYLQLQEGLRAAMMIMENDIRTAGTDPTGTAGARIITADTAELRFTRDITGGNINGRDSYDGNIGDPIEDVRFAINPDGHLGMELGGAVDDDELVPILDNVDVLNFVYLDRNENVLATPVGNTNNIRQVQVTIVARSDQSNRGLLGRHTDTLSYENQQGAVILAPQNDNVRRLRLSTTITCRNLVN